MPEYDVQKLMSLHDAERWLDVKSQVIRVTQCSNLGMQVFGFDQK